MYVSNTLILGNLLIDRINTVATEEYAATQSALKIETSIIRGNTNLNKIAATIFETSNTKNSGVYTITNSQFGYLIIKYTKISDDLRILGTTVGLKNVNYNTEAPNDDTEIKNESLLSPISVDGDMLFQHSIFMGKLNLDKAEVSGNLILDSSNLNSVNATLMRISKEFIITSSGEVPSSLSDAYVLKDFEPWGKGATLDISYSRFDSIASPWSLRAWPFALKIQGMKTNNIRAINLPGVLNLPPEHWFPAWLHLGTSNDFTPQPYKEVSQILRDNGDEQSASVVEYSARERQRITACKNQKLSDCSVLSLSKILIGYGYFIQWSLLWSAGFVLLGAWAFRHTPEAKRANMSIGITYSFDMFIPLIKLRESNYEIEILGISRYYFYFHRIAGWVMGSFIVAGLSGFTR